MRVKLIIEKYLKDCWWNFLLTVPSYLVPTPDFRDIALNMGLGDGQFLTPLRKSAKEHYFIDTVAKVSRRTFEHSFTVTKYFRCFFEQNIPKIEKFVPSDFSNDNFRSVSFPILNLELIRTGTDGKSTIPPKHSYFTLRCSSRIHDWFFLHSHYKAHHT